MLKTICLFYKQSVYSMIQHTIVMYCCHTYMLHWNDYKIILRQLKRRHYYQYYFVFHFLCKTLWNAAYYVKCFITHQVYAIILIKLVWIKKKDWSTQVRLCQVPVNNQYILIYGGTYILGLMFILPHYWPLKLEIW